MITEVLDKAPKVSSKLGFFRFRRFSPEEYVLSNDLGDYLVVKEESFKTLVSGKAIKDDTLKDKLVRMGVLNRDEFVSPDNIVRFRNRNMFLFQGPTLQIIVVTLRCNLKCSYCQASARKGSEHEFDMTEETARNVVDIAFQSPGPKIDFEFQGGEPLANWPIVEYIINYANRKALAENKDVFFSIVTNLVALTDEQLEFLVDNEVGISTSIDGHEELHNLHRGAGSHGRTVANLKKCTDKYKEKYVLQLPGALLTMTKDSLKYPTEIVDEYVRIGQESVQFRKVSPFGMAAQSMDKFNFTAEEYLEFYAKAFDHILKLNMNGTRITERTAYLFLVKMLTDYPVNHMDCRNPCGAGIGQIAYNFNGDVYTCDEGRMMAMMGQGDFKIGNVYENCFQDLVDNDVVKTLCVSSCLESNPSCNLCSYKPYCGVCPVYNFKVEGEVFGKEAYNDRCRVNMGIMDIIVDRGKDPKVLEIFQNWINDILLI